MSERSLNIGLRRAWIGALAIAGLLMAVSLASQPVAATSVIVRHYLVGTDPLCELARTACPAIAKADNGDKVEITGDGDFRPAGKKLDGAGTFVHKHGGRVLASGTWEAVRLISFVSYGSGSVQLLPPEFEGGLAVMSVHLTTTNGAKLDGILAVECTLGDSIPVGAEEGVTLSIPGLIDFDEKVSGLTLFITQV